MQNVTSAARSRHTTAIFLAILACFFVSGATGLLYQVIWTRKLVLLFGTASYAVSTVLSIFFFGLGAGSLAGGRLADRLRRPLFAYGIAEIIIGIWAALFILGIERGESAVVGLLQSFGPSRTAAIALRALLAVVFLIVPVTLMGATLPFLARFITRNNAPFVSRIGTLYSLNTLGAVLGCGVAGFFFLETLGYTASTFVGAAANIAIGVVAIGLSRKVEVGDPREQPQEEQSKEVAASSFTVKLVFLAFALSGFCSLALEVVWTRLLSIVFFGTTYAFTTMLCTVLLGIAIGSALASAFVERRRHVLAVFGLVQVLTAVSCVVMMTFFPSLPEWLETAQRDAGFDWSRLVWVKFVIVGSVLLPPMIFFGMSFPLAIHAAGARSGTIGASLGRLYAANTFGGVLGAAIGGFVLLPRLGAHTSILALALLLAMVGLLLIAATPSLSRVKRVALTALATACLVFVATLIPSDISRTLNEWFIPEDHEIIHYAEGVEGTVVVSAPVDESHGSGRYLWINAVQATASIDKGVKMNRFQGVLPLLFDRDPKSALFMCFGSGITAGTLALSPFDRVDAVEISRDVLEAAPLFAVDNLNVLEGPRIRTIVDDGRNYLLTTSEGYDLITFEPMPLALAGVSTFYTKDYYELCRAKLNDRGLVSQWIPFHSLSADLVRSLVHTFVDVFPNATGWFINADLFLVGSNATLRIDYEGAQERINANSVLRAALANVYLPDLEELIANFVMTPEALAAFAGDAPIMTDDRPWAEFLAPRLVYEQNVADAVAAMSAHVTSPLSILANRDRLGETIIANIERRHAAHVHDLEALQQYYAGTFGSKPETGFEESLGIDLNDYNAQYYLGEIYFANGQRHARWDEPEKAEEALLRSLVYAPNRLAGHLELADLYYGQGRRDEAAKHYERYLELGGETRRALDRASGPPVPNGSLLVPQ